MCQQLVTRHFGHNVKNDTENFQDDNSIYRFIEDDESNALNSGVKTQCEPRPGICHYGLLNCSMIKIFMSSYIASRCFFFSKLLVFV